MAQMKSNKMLDEAHEAFFTEDEDEPSLQSSASPAKNASVDRLPDLLENVSLCEEDSHASSEPAESSSR